MSIESGRPDFLASALNDFAALDGSSRLIRLLRLARLLPELVLLLLWVGLSRELPCDLCDGLRVLPA